MLQSGNSEIDIALKLGRSPHAIRVAIGKIIYFHQSQGMTNSAIRDQLCISENALTISLHEYNKYRLGDSIKKPRVSREQIENRIASVPINELSNQMGISDGKVVNEITNIVHSAIDAGNKPEEIGSELRLDSAIVDAIANRPRRIHHGPISIVDRLSDIEEKIDMLMKSVQEFNAKFAA